MIEDQKRHHLKGYNLYSQISARCHVLATKGIREKRLSVACAQQEIGATAYRFAVVHRDEYAKLI